MLSQFFKSRSNISRSFFERTLTTVSRAEGSDLVNLFTLLPLQIEKMRDVLLGAHLQAAVQRNVMGVSDAAFRRGEFFQVMPFG